jgi:pimeloyl-ACP methyl ester carboxylesterase
MSASDVRYYSGRDGARLAYRELGQGRPLVLLHGYLATAAATWLDSGIAEALTGHGYRAIMPDMRAHGDSARPHDPAAYPPDVLADDGLALLDQLELAEYDLAGYSLGARTAIRMLARGAAPGRAVVGGQGLEAVLHTAGRGGHFRHLLSNFGTFEPGSPEQQAEDRLTAAGADPDALVNIPATFANTSEAELAAIQVPVLVLTGAEDGHDETAAALASALPNGQYLRLPGNHYSAFITPEFLAAVTGFLGHAAAR